MVMSHIFQDCGWCSGTCFQQDDLCRLVLLEKLTYYEICCSVATTVVLWSSMQEWTIFREASKNKSDVFYLSYCKDGQLTKCLSNWLLLQFFFHSFSSEPPSSLLWNIALTSSFISVHLVWSIFYDSVNINFPMWFPRVFRIKQFKFCRRQTRTLSRSGLSMAWHPNWQLLAVQFPHQ